MLQTMAECVVVCVRNAGGFLKEAAGCTGPGLAFERIMWKCMSQGIEAPSRIWRKQRQAEMTEQEMPDCRQSSRVQTD